ncbi:MAG: phage terminase small subunit P27 family [Pseudomonadota bacterium]
MKGPKPSLPTANVVPMPGIDAAPIDPPEPPTRLHNKAAAVWREIVPELCKKGRWSPLYQFEFEAYCECYAEWQDLIGDIAAEGYTFSNEGDRPDGKAKDLANGVQQKANPKVGQKNDILRLMKSYGAVFGLTPVDEQRLKDSGQGDLFGWLNEQLNKPN